MRLGQNRHPPPAEKARPLRSTPVGPPPAAVSGLPPDARRPTSSLGGVLRPDQARRHFTLTRPPADPRLTTWVERYWSVSWTLPRGTHYDSEVLTHPSVHLSIESGDRPDDGFDSPAALVHGVVTRRFVAPLRGRGRVLGVKFRPGGFGAFTGLDVATLTDTVHPMTEVFDQCGGFPEPASFLAAEDDHERRRVMDEFLLGLVPSTMDPAYPRLLTIVSAMLTDRSLISVDQVTSAFDIPARTLQRLFRRYVGVSPKWVLRRFRLHDAVNILDQGTPVDLSTLAGDLGWFDQAHFTRDFTDAVGVSPRAYRPTHRTATRTSRIAVR